MKEMYGHKGQFCFMSGFSPAAWVEGGGRLIESDDFGTDEDFDYKLRADFVTDFAQFKAACASPASFQVIDTRPWIYRKIKGEYREPNVGFVSFFELFKKDQKTGASVMKSPRSLSRIFEREIKINEGSVVFACEWGVSSCKGLMALKHLQTC